MPTGYVIPVLIEEGLIQPIDVAAIPNFANLDPDLADPNFDPGNQYSLPWFYGTVAIGYNRARTGVDITSWADVFAYDGPVAWLEDRRAMLGVALSILGYDPNSENVDEINEAAQFLIENSGNVVTIAQDDGQVLLARGDVDITVEYNGDIIQIASDCAADPNCTDDFVYAYPEEIANLWVDNMIIPTGAPNVALAQVFMDYVYDPQIAAINANDVQYSSPNQVAIDAQLIDAELLSNPSVYISDELSATQNFFTILDLPEAEEAYSDAWEEVKLNIGG